MGAIKFCIRMGLRPMPPLLEKCSAATVNELWPQTRTGAVFVYTILCIITPTTRKLKVAYREILPSNDCSTIKDIYSLG